MTRQSLWRCAPNAVLTLLALALLTLGTAQSRTDCLPSAPNATSPFTLYDAAPAQSPKPQPASASEIPIWKTIALGEYKGVNAVRMALDNAPCPIAVGDWADEILGRPAFPFSKTKAEVDLVVLSVADLGFTKKGASLRDIYTRALALGLETCPAEVGPVLRLNYLNQPVGEFLHIAMRPIARYSGELVDFMLANGGAGLLLVGGDARPEVVLPGAARFAFVRPRADTIASDMSPAKKLDAEEFAER
jgi:hypothetical protein